MTAEEALALSAKGRVGAEDRYFDRFIWAIKTRAEAGYEDACELGLAPMTVVKRLEELGYRVSVSTYSYTTDISWGRRE